MKSNTTVTTSQQETTMSPSTLLPDPPASTDIPPYSPKIAIIGAGIAGVALSIALARQNPALQVIIYERRSHISEVGVGVGIGPNSVRAMGRISPELRRAYDGIVTLNGLEDKLNTDFDIYYGDGDRRGSFLGEMLAREGIPHGGVGRIALMDALAALVPAEVEVVFDKKVRDVRWEPGSLKGEMVVSFADGTEARVDAVVACDGIRSSCRGMIIGEDHPAAQPAYTGRYGFRAIIPMEQAVAAIGPNARTRRLIVGRGRHILFFPVQKGKGMNIAAFVDSGGKPWPYDKWVVPATKEDILQDFEGFDDDSMRLLQVCLEVQVVFCVSASSNLDMRFQAIETTDKWALFDHPDAPTFLDPKSGRFCLLGDAAHASTPHCGAGAGMAFEDAYVLSSLMRSASIRSVGDIEKAFRAYDAVRRPRSQELVRRSRRQGGLFCLQFAEGHELLADFETNMKWIWDVDFDEMLGVAEEAFAEGACQHDK